MRYKQILRSLLVLGVVSSFILIHCGTGTADEPTFISMDPDILSSMVGDPQVFTLTLSDVDGYEDIQIVRMEIRDASGTSADEDTIILEYYRSNNKVVMYNHDVGRYKGGVPGSDLVIEDSLCSFDIAQTTVEGDGDLLTINWHITPQAAFTGDKIIWLNVFDYDMNRLRIDEMAFWTISLGQTYAVDMGISPVGSGSTFPSEGVHFYQENEQVSIIANANSGYRFMSWTGDVDDPYAQSTTITIDSDMIITANFEGVPAYTLSIGTDPFEGGTTSPTVGDHLYSEDEVVPVAATAGTGYRFVSWTGDVDDPYAPSTTVTIDSDKIITANFEEVPAYTLSIGTDPFEGGTTSPTVGDHPYSEDEVVSVVATANTGYRFVSWTGDVDDPYAPSTTVTIDSDKIITANFEEGVTTDTFTVDFDFANVDDITYLRIGADLPFEITREDFIAAGFNTSSGDLFIVEISHMHNGDKPENPENWVLSFDDGSGVEIPIATLSYSALGFINETIAGSFDLSGLDWKFVITETSDDGPYDRDRLFLDKLTLTNVLAP